MALYQNFTSSQNGTITLPGSIIGTHSNNTISNLFTANNNVGINTTNPLFTLDVTGTIDSDAYTGGNISISGTVSAPTYTGANISISGSLNAATNIAAIGNITNGGFDFVLGNANQSSRGNSGQSRALVKNTGSVLQINFAGDFTGGTEVQGPSLTHTGFFIASGNSNTLGNLCTTGGNVGIGTRTPTYQLTLTGNIGMDNGTIMLARNSASTYENFLWPRWTDNIMYLNYGSAGFHIRNNASTSAMFMNNSTNIGIGTTSPGYKLEVNGVIKNNADILMDSASRLTIYNNTGGLQIRSGGSNMLHLNQDNNANISIGVGGGNVGIGTTAPNWKLDVVGAVECTDWFRSLNNTGWYNQTYGRGIYMTDSTWVRTYPDRSAFLCGTLNCNDITTNSNNIAMAGGTITFSNNGAGLNWGSSFSRIYDDGHLRIYTDDNMYFNIGGTDRLYINSMGLGVCSNTVVSLLCVNGDAVGNGALQVVSTTNTINNGRSQDGASFKAWNDGNNIIQFYNSANGYRGGINGNGSGAVTYNTSSDRRLKENVNLITNATQIIKQMRPVEFTWKSDHRKDFGFIAQEIFEIFPTLRPNFSSYSHCECSPEELSQGILCDCSEHNHDEPIDKDGKPLYYGLDYGKFTPYLTQALQETISELEESKTEINNLKTENQNLKNQIQQLFQHLGLTPN